MSSITLESLNTLPYWEKFSRLCSTAKFFYFAGIYFHGSDDFSPNKVLFVSILSLRVFRVRLMYFWVCKIQNLCCCCCCFFHHLKHSLSWTFLLLPWEFEIAVVDCNYNLQKQLAVNNFCTMFHCRCFDRILNLPRVLNIPLFWIFQGYAYASGSEYARVLKMLGLHRVLSIPALFLGMPFTLIRYQGNL